MWLCHLIHIILSLLTCFVKKTLCDAFCLFFHSSFYLSLSLPRRAIWNKYIPVTQQHTSTHCLYACMVLKLAVEIKQFPGQLLYCRSVLQIRDNWAIWKLLCWLAVMDHVEGMSAALGSIIVNLSCVRENSAGLTITDALIISGGRGMPLYWKFSLSYSHHAAESLYLSIRSVLFCAILLATGILIKSNYNYDKINKN